MILMKISKNVRTISNFGEVGVVELSGRSIIKILNIDDDVRIKNIEYAGGR